MSKEAEANANAFTSAFVNTFANTGGLIGILRRERPIHIQRSKNAPADAFANMDMFAGASYYTNLY